MSMVGGIEKILYRSELVGNGSHNAWVFFTVMLSGDYT
jgi:hypothetical protein